MRLFTGLDLSVEAVASLDGLVEQLRPTARLRWSPPANLHVTIRFIGEWPEERLAELRTVLAGLPRHAPIGIQIRKLGFFPNPHSPRIFWAGVDAGPDLATLAGETDRALEPLGLAAEGRPYSPHLTLGRVKDPVPMQPLREAIAALPSLDFGSYTAPSFFLYQSRTGPSGSVYTKLAEFPFSK